jgi:hypothetical protein
VSIGELAHATPPSEEAFDAADPLLPAESGLGTAQCEYGDAAAPIPAEERDADASSDSSLTGSDPLHVEAQDSEPPDASGGAWPPCAGKVCGAWCGICPPADLHCIETAVIKMCNAAGECRPDVPTCDGGV